MKKKRGLLVAFLTLSLIGLAVGGCAPTKTSRVRVVTTTSLLTYITQQVGGDKIEVVSIVPPTQHPGDFDAKPGDIQRLAEASLFLWHNWPGETFVPGLISSANHSGLTVAAIDIKGNWMTPPVQREAADKIAAALSQADSQNSAAYQQAASAYKDRVTAKENELKAKLGTNLAEVNVIGSFWQAGFIGWAGMKVVATYVDPVSLTPALSKDLVDKGKTAKVSLIIDNLQNGADAGKAIAEELGVKRITLSNFPGGFSNTETWEKAIEKNVELILGATSK